MNQILDAQEAIANLKLSIRDADRSFDDLMLTGDEWIHLLQQSGIPESTTVVVLSGEPPVRETQKKKSIKSGRKRLSD